MTTKKTKTATSKETTADMLDGMPDWFVGPLLADLVAHEVGHTLGLRHNFKASALLLAGRNQQRRNQRQEDVHRFGDGLQPHQLPLQKRQIARGLTP